MTKDISHKETIRRFSHAHLYYMTMIVSLIFGVFCLVQGALMHAQDEINFALAFYTIGILLLVIARACQIRGKGHYQYHAHIS